MKRFWFYSLMVLLTACGASKDSEQSAVEPQENEGPVVAVLEPTFTTIQERIFFPKCTPCHTKKAAHGISLTSYAAVLENTHWPPLVAPGDPEGSALYQSLIAEEDFMPRNGNRLSSEEIAAVYEWIKLGAKDD